MLRSFLIASALVLAGPVSAASIGFDDLSAGNEGIPIPNGYAGFNWSNFFALDATEEINSGYINAVISQTNVAYNGSGLQATLSADDPFRLTNGWFTAAWNDGLQLSISGSLEGAVLYAFVVELDTDGPLNVLFPAIDVDAVLFSSSGGVKNPNFNGIGTQFVLDNLNGAGGVPEPATWAMLIAGFGLVGGMLRRRRPLAA